MGRNQGIVNISSVAFGNPGKLDIEKPRNDQ